MLGRRRWLSVVLVAVVAFAGLGTSASADPSSESEFLALHNAERAAQGLAPLTVDSNLRSWARTHSQFMADGGCPDGKSICHSSGDQLIAAAGTGWSKVGENVGVGGTVSGIHQAFMNSPGHRANILDPTYNYVGIGTVHVEDRIFVTVVFMAKGGGGGSTPTTTEAKTTTSAAPTTTAPTTTTTLPPTTTTTLIVGPDKPVTPGQSCPTVTSWWWMCRS
ncbi:MAG: CAP domain-containing protein [Actinobacteria bacterium]|nr:CAP domain-containing protein [Actinomycetota bacterium]MCI0544835.1 CAP domain-containing protein [Actinomycetota bacterium]